MNNIVYYKYFSWEQPEVIEASIAKRFQTKDLKVSFVRDLRGEEPLNLKSLINDKAAEDEVNLWIPSLDHFEEYLSDKNSFLVFLELLITRGFKFHSLDESLTFDESAFEFVRKLVPAIETAKRFLKSARIRDARITAKNAGDQVGAVKKRDDELIKKLRAEGLSIRQIAEQIGLSTFPVSEALKT